MKNRLAQSTSPYLLQHADNPVDWYPWGNEALAKAKAEDKPIIVSIGYSSCHWCHVMAHESFEDDATAAIMNEHFVNIKVDREERPDVDQIYMDAIQKMGLHGGWPLNVFLTPEAKPFYGGTYFPREGWKGLLQNVATAFRENRTRIEESAVQFAAAIGQSEFAQFSRHEGDFQFSKEQMNALYQNLSRRFDVEWGGIKKAPKFPMPVIWEMLDVYAYRADNQEAANHLLFTLEKIAAGGIYDQIGGGFARYSVDGQWHVSHFEKMLYDNGQLLRRYAAAYKRTGDAKYKRVLIETARWLQREMLRPDGGFYAALDADSEGVEGKFYVWDIEEIETLAGDDAAIIKAYYDVQPKGNWEDGHNVLRRLASDSEIAGSFGITDEQLHKVVQDFNEKALNQREQRIRPGLDNKRIAGWNGLILSGLCEAYQATGDELFLKLAKNAAAFLSSLVHQGQLARFPDQAMEGFLEDYAAVIQGFIIYYQTVFDAQYFRLAQQLTDRTLEAFFDEQEGFFFFTSREAEALIARKKEVFDNVIPSSNSMMARNLFHLGTLLYDDDYVGIAREMVRKMVPLIPQEPEYLANWATLAMEMSGDFAEIVIVGPDYQCFAEEIHRRHLPMKVISAAPVPSDEPMFEMKPLQDGRTTIYVCYNRTCQLPVTSVEEALGQVRR